MKKFLRLLLIILGLLALGIAIYFAPLEQILVRIPYANQFLKNTSLTVTTRAGNAEVLVNNQNYGQTPVTITNLEEGRYLVQLKKISEVPELYKTQEFYINLHRNTESIIDMEIAPDDFKAGYILYYEPAPKSFSDQGYLTVQSSLNDFQVKINDETLKENFPVQLKSGEYRLKIESKGYETLEFPVIVRSGYNLNATTYLLPIPIIL